MNTPLERRGKILEHLQKFNEIKVTKITELFDISDVTARKELINLEKEGLLVRVHGGAILTNKNIQNLSYQEIMETRRTEKVAISKAIKNIITDRHSIILSAGSTNIYVARELVKLTNLTIITNSLNIAFEFQDNPNSHVILIGGSFDPIEHTTYGEDTINQLTRYKADKLIMSVDGVSTDHGITIYRIEESDFYKKMIERAKMIILAADYTKIGNVALTRICEANEIDVLVTNKCANPEEIGKLRSIGVDIVLA